MVQRAVRHASHAAFFEGKTDEAVERSHHAIGSPERGEAERERYLGGGGLAKAVKDDVAAVDAL
jgi:hypothetical protein